MRILLFLAVLMFPVSAFALSDSLIDYCLTTPDPRACLKSVSADVQASRENFQRDLQQRQYDTELEQARIQANGMALFGSGHALIQGMNQGFQNMQQPYISTPPIQYPPSRR
jgi:hypothetical protein